MSLPLPMTTPDVKASLKLARCELLKIDVEGMELAVLQGARNTIERLRPILYVENSKEERSAALVEYLQSLGVRTGDIATLDFDNDMLTLGDRTFSLKPMGDVRPVIEAGGIFNYARKNGMIPSKA